MSSSNSRLSTESVLISRIVLQVIVIKRLICDVVGLIAVVFSLVSKALCLRVSYGA